MQIAEHMLWPVTRHKELIAEARQIHEAARAVRGARRDEGQDMTKVVKRGAPPYQRKGVGSLPSRRTAWRSAAWRMGHSLVVVGRRLERLGDAAD